ncbi:MAG: N-acetylmuramoyl-L-alanine amidase [Proteobacteria bacterium]|nr:N-acetylmuramoyl-L-alanine amidase [Pseudomonadota bacterium]
MKTLFIEAGHNNNDPGAVNSQLNLKEADLTKELRDLIYAHLQILGYKHNIVLDKDAYNLNQTIAGFKTAKDGQDVVLSIHFNAASPAATGCEVIVDDKANSGEKLLAAELINAVISELPIKNRGVKSETETHRGKIGIVNLNAKCVLIEVCFISNPDEIKAYQKVKGEIAKNIAKVLATSKNA